MPDPPRGFTWIDWSIVAGYLVLMGAVGALVARRRGDAEDFFLGGRRMPMGAVALSILATSLSAATFIGAPQQAYASDLTYFSANIGGLIAAVIVATIFVPAFYRHGVTSIYELLGDVFGTPAHRAASAMFMIGRVFASGARLFMVAIPFALIAFGDLERGSLITSILLITAVATAYTAIGGIRAVIWTDVIQAVVVVGTVTLALVMLLGRLPIGGTELIAALRDGPTNKLHLLDFSLDPARPFTVWTALIGFTLFNVAAFGTDQDLTQRMLTCRSARRGAWSVIISNALSWPVVMLFLMMGVLLHVYYARPDIMGDAAPIPPEDSRRVFLQFMLAEMPTGMRGLMMAGLFAAAMSSLDSALNAMASTTVADFVRPVFGRRSIAINELAISRIAIVGWAAALACFAIGCVWWQKASGQTLIAFALGVMVFAYAGLLGVFATALLTKRGNSRSAVAALLAGFVAVVIMQPAVWGRLMGLLPEGVRVEMVLAFPWKMTVATTLAFAVCCAGRRKPNQVA